MANKVAFIGAKEIHAALSELDANLDFQKPVETLAELEQELRRENRELISNDTSVIIMFSHLFKHEDKDLFVSLATYLAPYSAICILHPDSDGEDMKELINQSIRAQLEAYSAEDPAYHANIPYYFIAYENPYEDLSEALVQYINSQYANESAKANILNSLPDNVARRLENDYYQGEAASPDPSLQDTSTHTIPEKRDGAGRVIAVTSSKGGSGKSTVTMLLAHYLAEGSKRSVEAGNESSPLKVCVVDLDIRDGQLGFLNGATEPTIAHILKDGAITPESISKGLYHSSSVGCDFVFATKNPNIAGFIPISVYSSLIDELRMLYDYVILDTSVNYLDVLLSQVAYPMADKILFVTDMGISSIYGMNRWIGETTSIRDDRPTIPRDKIGIVINKAMKGINMDFDRIKRAALGLPMVGMFPSEPNFITYAANNCALEQVVNHKVFNERAYSLANSIVEPTGYKLSEIPYVG